MQNLILETAELIAQYDAAAARAFVSKPFHREALAKAFRAGFRNHSERTLRDCSLVDRCVDLDKRMRQLAD